MELKLCKEGDEEMLSSFHSDVCGAKSPPPYWSWKYFKNPAGEPVVALFLDGGEIVGRFGILPVRMRITSEEVMGGQMVDTDILEEYRWKGLIQPLEKMAREEFSKRNGAFTFGFGKDTTVRLATRFSGFKKISEIRMMVKILDPAVYIAKRLKVDSMPDFIGNCAKKFIGWRNRAKSKHDVHISAIFCFESSANC